MGMAIERYYEIYSFHDPDIRDHLFVNRSIGA